MMLKHHDRQPSLNPSRKLQNEKFRHRRWIWLDCNLQSVSANMGLLCGKSDLEPNTRVVDHFLIFPIVIFMPLYDIRFRSYANFWVGWTAEILLWADLSSLRNLNFWPKHKYNLRILSILSLQVEFSAFLWIFTRPHTISGLGVMTFRSRLGRSNSVLNRFGYFENFAILTPIQRSSWESYSSNITANSPVFLAATHVPQFD
jgi:hypothetical protein